MEFRLKETRENVRMTQEELALKSGISLSTILELESGKITATTLKTLAKIADALETTIDEMFNLNNYIAGGC